MTMKAVGNVDTILIEDDRLFSTKVVATYRPLDSCLEIHSGYTNHLGRILETLRKYQRARDQLVTPIRVEYW